METLKSYSKRMSRDVIPVIQGTLVEKADAAKALAMQKYCKTSMPMYGIQRADRHSIEKQLYTLLETTFPTIKSEETIYQECIRSLWNLPHREEKYLAIDMAIHYRKHIKVDSIHLYEEMLREDYMWWDLCDPIAVNLVGKAVQEEYRVPDRKVEVQKILQRWIQDNNLWICRAAILAQLKFKQETDENLLFEFCRLKCSEKDFFIRKAIGWALREYSKTNPGTVQKFLVSEKPNLSALSFNEGVKHLKKLGKKL